MLALRMLSLEQKKVLKQLSFPCKKVVQWKSNHFVEEDLRIIKNWPLPTLGFNLVAGTLTDPMNICFVLWIVLAQCRQVGLGYESCKIG